MDIQNKIIDKYHEFIKQYAGVPTKLYISENSLLQLQEHYRSVMIAYKPSSGVIGQRFMDMEIVPVEEQDHIGVGI